jgi:hypothetical protein
MMEQLGIRRKSVQWQSTNFIPVSTLTHSIQLLAVLDQYVGSGWHYLRLPLSCSYLLPSLSCNAKLGLLSNTGLAATSGGEGDSKLLLWNILRGELVADLNAAYRYLSLILLKSSIGQVQIKSLVDLPCVHF